MSVLVEVCASWLQEEEEVLWSVEEEEEFEEQEVVVVVLESEQAAKVWGFVPRAEILVMDV